MQSKLLFGILGLVSLTWSAPATPEEIRTQQSGNQTSVQAESRAIEAPPASLQLDATKQPVDALLQAQLDALDLQKRQLVEAAQEQIRQAEEQVHDQIEQWKSDVARQIEQLKRSAKKQTEQTRSHVKRQVELLEAQKKLLVAETGVTKTIRQATPATAPKAGAGAVEEKLDKILDRLERLEKRFNKLGKGPAGGF